MTEDTIPRAKVEEIAAAVHKLQTLKAKQQTTQAQLIRWCLWALKQDERTGVWGYREAIAARHKIRADKILAIKSMEWLADKLEGKDSPAPQLTKGTKPCITEE